MSNYGKSVLALVIAFVAALGVWLWLQYQMDNLEQIRNAISASRERAMLSQMHEKLAAQAEVKIKELRAEIRPIADRLIKEDAETSQLVMTVMKSAGAAGMELINASRPEEEGEREAYAEVDDHCVCCVQHEIQLRGSYKGLVTFLQNMQTRDIALRVIALQIFPVPEEVKKTGKKVEQGDVEVILRLGLGVLRAAS